MWATPALLLQQAELSYLRRSQNSSIHASNFALTTLTSPLGLNKFKLLIPAALGNAISVSKVELNNYEFILVAKVRSSPWSEYNKHTSRPLNINILFFSSFIPLHPDNICPLTFLTHSDMTCQWSREGLNKVYKNYKRHRLGKQSEPFSQDLKKSNTRGYSYNMTGSNFDGRMGQVYVLYGGWLVSAWNDCQGWWLRQIW